MQLADDEQKVSEYFFKGARSTSVLTSKRLVLYYKNNEESYPLSKVTSVKVGFTRSVGTMVVGMLIAVSGLVSGLAVIYNTNRIENSLPFLAEQATQGVPGSADLLTRGRGHLEKGKMLAPLAVVLSLGGGVPLVFIGWRGQTRLEVASFAGSKSYLANGKNSSLIDFGQAVAHQLS